MVTPRSAFQLPPDSRLVFQGDSITDCGRDRSKDGSANPAEIGLGLGSGYALLLASQFLADQPADRLAIRNLGISGNRIVDLAARAQEHIWNLRPTHLSILIGVNDTWHHFMRGAGVDLRRYERAYRQLLADTRERLPEIRFILCEPFLLPCGVAAPGWREEIDQRRAVVATLAREFSATLVPFQAAFDEACRRAPADHWAPDGVHPSPAGHRLMADTWLAALAR
jgi:lysophospholipase L1-like esterase